MDLIFRRTLEFCIPLRPLKECRRMDSFKRWIMYEIVAGAAINGPRFHIHTLGVDELTREAQCR